MTCCYSRTALRKRFHTHARLDRLPVAHDVIKQTVCGLRSVDGDGEWFDNPSRVLKNLIVDRITVQRRYVNECLLVR